MTTSIDSIEINVRASRYLIARTEATCLHCGEPTTLVALCLPPGHEVVDFDDTPPQTGVSDWGGVDSFVLLFHVGYLPDAVQVRLQEITRRYTFDSRDANCWTNHCEACGRGQDDSALFCEPDGAFLPTSEAGAKLIRLASIEESIEAIAGGFAYEPEFFHAATRS